MLNADALPFDLLAVLALMGWSAYIAVILCEAHSRRVLAQGREHGVLDHEVQGDEAEHDRQDDRREEQQHVSRAQHSGIHSRSVHPSRITSTCLDCEHLSRLDMLDGIRCPYVESR